ncbi:hypothetical protein AC482_07405 [miscellaneous Crenarchaeota group-15 archaeon DG-45]|uniref:Uncharacterized protein n=1 Tax=miscellaneous Crenarchaeota group-15 archaeon DG-45 TaxID=1685127 RepID=A0A0M0BL12_9ARCH|nr:MAG: hypothetical protein AC482_07405 [miscellaneous Crenarchaeota group-15 archaeon DG-45]
MSEARLGQLAGFIRELGERAIFHFDISDFDSRVKLQKYVYLARNYGFNHEYKFNLYIRGPYSKELAKDYYSITDETVNYVRPRLNEDFYRIINGKNTRWLELAATYCMIRENNPNLDNDILVRYVRMAKDYARSEEVLKIIRDLG